MSDSTVTNIISFGGAVAAASGLIVAEIDGAMHLDGDGNERSSFLPGEPVYFLLHYDASKVRIIRLRSTDDGDVRRIGQVTRERLEQITWQHPAHLIDLRYLPAGSLSAKWYGRGSNLYRNVRQVQADLAPCLGDISYPVQFVQYLHVPAVAEIPDGEEFPADIIIEYQEIK